MYIAILFVSLFLPSTVLVGVFMHTQTHSLFLSSANRTNVGHVTSHHDGPCLVQRSFSWSFSTPKSIKLHKFCFVANYGGSEAAKEKKNNCSTSTFKIISTLFISDSQKNRTQKKWLSARDRFSSPEENSPSLELFATKGHPTCFLSVARQLVCWDKLHLNWATFLFF